MQKVGWFYSVTWYESLIFHTEFYDNLVDAVTRFRELKRQEWQTKARELHITRFGNFALDFTPVEEEAS